MWQLSPAYDVMWSYNPAGAWTNQHQMTVNGKRDGSTLVDLEAVGRVAHLPRGRARATLGEVVDVVATWPAIASDVGVEPAHIDTVAQSHLSDALRS